MSNNPGRIQTQRKTGSERVTSEGTYLEFDSLGNGVAQGPWCGPAAIPNPCPFRLYWSREVTTPSS